MSLTDWYLRRRINGAREGKEGAAAMGIVKALDGYKRIIVLALYIVCALLVQTGHGDYTGYLGTLLKALDWNADGVLPIPAATIAGTVAGVVAIVHALLKALAEKTAAANTVTLPK